MYAARSVQSSSLSRMNEERDVDRRRVIDDASSSGQLLGSCCSCCWSECMCSKQYRYLESTSLSAKSNASL